MSGVLSSSHSEAFMQRGYGSERGDEQEKTLSAGSKRDVPRRYLERALSCMSLVSIFAVLRLFTPPRNCDSSLLSSEHVQFSKIGLASELPQREGDW